jgi:hypothetical protein
MRRSIINVAIAALTFFTGLAVELSLTADRHADHARTATGIGSTTTNAPESCAPVNPAQPAPGFKLDYNPREFNPRGDYFILGRKPKGLREFNCFELAVDEMNGKPSGDGSFETYSKGTYDPYYSVTGLVTKERLTFIAAPTSEEDFEYSFDGRFLRGGFVSGAGRNEAVIKGKLIKSKDGVKVAEGVVRFRVKYLGC